MVETKQSGSSFLTTLREVVIERSRIEQRRHGHDWVRRRVFCRERLEWGQLVAWKGPVCGVEVFVAGNFVAQLPPKATETFGISFGHRLIQTFDSDLPFKRSKGVDAGQQVKPARLIVACKVDREPGDRRLILPKLAICNRAPVGSPGLSKS